MPRDVFGFSGAFSDTPGSGTFTNSCVWCVSGGVCTVKVCATSSASTCVTGLPR